MAKQDEVTTKAANAWLIQSEGDGTTLAVSLTDSLDAYRGIVPGDGCVLVGVDNVAKGIGRVFRLSQCGNSTSLCLDGFMPAPAGLDLAGKGLAPKGPNPQVLRLEWSAFEAILREIGVADFSRVPPLSGSTSEEQTYLRDLLQRAAVDDLLGPANGPHEEIVDMSVRDRYLLGKLAPRDSVVEEDDDLAGASGTVGTDEVTPEVDASTNQSIVPSSFGFTFCVDAAVTSLTVEARWGRYERGTSETQVDEETGKALRAWKRIPSGGSKTITLTTGDLSPTALDAECPEVVVQGSIREPSPNGDRLVTLFLVNNHPIPEENRDAAWVFQPELIVRGGNGKPIFRRRPMLEIEHGDSERTALEMIYRNRVEFAVGHGVSVHAQTSNDEVDLAVEIRTVVVPDYEVQATETPGIDPSDRPAMRQMVAKGWLDMRTLASADMGEVKQALELLANDYEAWIDEEKGRIGTDVAGYGDAATEAMARCTGILERLREGISTLEKDTKAFEAFRFANEAMAAQRVRSLYALHRRRGGTADLAAFDIPQNRSWRPFQLAFVLLSVPALANPLHSDRTEPLEAIADLLWFPTGGGKTEAYLGVAAFTMAIRRLQGSLGGMDGQRGLAVIMRYTLRLLTLQQFQRASTLICAMEVMRRQDPKKWGAARFTLGLWVGQKVTPNTTEESHEAIERERDGKFIGGSTPAQLTSCPWCGSEIAAGRDIRVSKDIGRTAIHCGDKLGACDFSHAKATNVGLPVTVVDEELYHRPPTMLIATVDKFAMMAWRGQVRTLFGRVSQECPRHGLLWPEAACTGTHPKKATLAATTAQAVRPIRPPDLVIQDEFHLISGPLGTMVGLYETAVDELATWRLDGKSVRPKVIASTATVRKAHEQVNNVFLRRVSVFPPHGLDVDDNYFSVQRPTSKRPGRRYVGICSPGSSRPAVLIRVYVALLTAAQALFERFGAAADPYMTLVGYFNSLRELGGMKRLAEDDVQTRAYRVQMSRVARPGLHQRAVKIVDELTSRVSSKDIPRKLDLLEVKFKASWAKGEARAMDVVLATNMLSVGVDVNRLGLMVVNGQPKSTAEYIQATSRVGRAFPGLVFTVLTWSRPRDLSHYETFEHYHATFYKHVEAQSVTPFSPRALDRGLTGAMVSLMRLDRDDLNPNSGAERLTSTAQPEVAAVKKVISDRAWKVTDKNAVKSHAEAMTADRVDRWVKEATKPGRHLGYEPKHGKGDVVGLLRKPGGAAWDAFTVPMSMREVEPGVQLVMDAAKLPDPPSWRVKAKVAGGTGGAA